MKFYYNTQLGNECVEADLGDAGQAPMLRIINAVGASTEIYCHDLNKLLANIMLANEYVKENKQ